MTDTTCGSGLRATSPSGDYTVTVEPATAVTVLCRAGGGGSRVAIAGLNPAAGEVTAVAVDDTGGVALGRRGRTRRVLPRPTPASFAAGAPSTSVSVASRSRSRRSPRVVVWWSPACDFPVPVGTPARVVVWHLDTLVPTSFATDFEALAGVTVLDPRASVVAVAGRDDADGPVTIQLWETGTLRRVGRAFSGLAGDVTVLIGAETAIVGGDESGRVYRWEVDRDPTREVCEIVGRTLTDDEWDTIAGGVLRRYDFHDALRLTDVSRRAARWRSAPPRASLARAWRRRPGALCRPRRRPRDRRR